MKIPTIRDRDKYVMDKWRERYPNSCFNLEASDIGDVVYLYNRVQDLEASLKAEQELCCQYVEDVQGTERARVKTVDMVRKLEAKVNTLEREKSALESEMQEATAKLLAIGKVADAALDMVKNR